MPELERFYRRNRDNNLLLVGINVEENREKVAAFREKFDLTFPLLLNEDGVISERYDVMSYPRTIVIGPFGRVQLYEIGMISNADLSLEPLLSPNNEVFSKGGGMTKERFLEEVENSRRKREKKEKSEGLLEGLSPRAVVIAKTMPCPCGCEQGSVKECSCGTAKKVIAALRKEDLEGRDTAAVIRELNRRFCVGGKK